ncbi:hypothetical protein [Enterococcus sp. HY326]|uniref:hypothetical protein n=1 Tax=Enterococcus sp. HY326 TaxID=2971265 RepID=UPI00223F5BC4|nr:hypothetical protein [Enterococcus sp. HY326]
MNEKLNIILEEQKRQAEILQTIMGCLERKVYVNGHESAKRRDMKIEKLRREVYRQSSKATIVIILALLTSILSIGLTFVFPSIFMFFVSLIACGITGAIISKFITF